MYRQDNLSQVIKEHAQGLNSPQAEPKVTQGMDCVPAGALSVFDPQTLYGSVIQKPN